ncbi:MAG: 2-oxoglutarate dehydrogenase, E2 component, dihydrolipoamide succinyltransferase [Actinomycetaceae bacterium]|nr:2-oxoglutarate dehydrogenase, E2 component, dihydrolipoamide succinyltransferase [Actinomycetaceae bacterium]
MSTSVEMPALGESVTEGTISQWLKEVGDTVEVDEPIVEVATDKVDSEVPAPVAGTIIEICVEEDETVDVGTVICKIGDADETSSSEDKEEPKEEKAPEVPAEEAEPEAEEDAAHVEEAKAPEAPAAPEAPQAPEASSDSVGEGGFYVTPLVRKLAKDKGVDLATVKGTGQGGRIRKQDVLEAAEAKAKAPAPQAPQTAEAEAPKAPAAAGKPASSPIEEDTTLRGKTEKMSRMRQTIADRMMTSLSSTAQLTTVVEVDVTRIATLRARAKNSFLEREGTKLSFLPFFVKAATEALKAHPKINSRIEGKEVTYFAEEHVGIAVDTERGLMVPVIKNCGDLTIAGIAKKINELAEETRTGKIDPGKLSGSTFTITNTGSRGALFDTPVVNYPEEAILGLGTIVKRPAVIKDGDGNDTIAIRSMCYLALSYDHRLIDGADAARYLSTVKKRLEDGDFAAELGL